jgi:acyl-CoA hydrolase
LKKKPVRESAVVLSRILMPSDANALGNVHGGVMMKEIDNAAAIAAVKHCRNILVTASIDSLDFHMPALINELLILKASVNYVGETSMEVGVRAECESLLSGEIKHIASAYLTLVAIERSGRPKKIEWDLELETDDDRRRHADAVERKKTRALEREAKNERKNKNQHGR